MNDKFYINNVTGLLDVDAFVQSLTLSKQKALQKLSQEKALRQAKATSLTNLLSEIKGVKDFLSQLKPEEGLMGKKLNLSDQTVLSGSVSKDTPNLLLKVKVENLSQKEILVSSAGVSNLETTLSSSTITLRYYTEPSNYQETTVNFSGGKLSDLVEAINKAQDKVQASVFFDGSKYKLLLSEKDEGASTKETAIGDTVIQASALPTELGSLETLQTAKNAQIRLSSETGPQLTSATNTFEEVVPGLTLTALKTSTDFINVSVEEDYGKGKNMFSDLLKKVNESLDLLNSMTGKGGIFQGNATLIQIKSSFFRLTKPLQELGLVNIGDDGKYSLNTTTFDQLISKGEVTKLQETLNSVKTNLGNYLEGLEKTFQAYKKTEDQAISRLDKKASQIQEDLLREEKKLRITFTKIESLMSRNETLKSRLDSFVKGLSETTKQ